MLVSSIVCPCVCALVHVARSISMDAATRYFGWSCDDHVDADDNHVVERISCKPFVPTSKQVADIIMCRHDALGGLSVFDIYAGACTQAKTAKIGRIRFTAGEPLEGNSHSHSSSHPHQRVYVCLQANDCPGGTTNVVDRSSQRSWMVCPGKFHPDHTTHTAPLPLLLTTRRYGIIDTFLTPTSGSAGGFACVRWFRPPVYLHSCMLIVKIEDRRDFDDSLPSVISIYDIDPSRVIIEDCKDDVGVFFMRIEGYDTCEISNRYISRE